MRVFDVIRWKDHTKVSGRGLVAKAVEFDSGKTVVAWQVKGRPKSLAIYNSLKEATEVHGHNGDTEFILVWEEKDSAVYVTASKKGKKK